jgi:hypothetical protein
MPRQSSTDSLMPVVLKAKSRFPETETAGARALVRIPVAPKEVQAAGCRGHAPMGTLVLLDLMGGIALLLLGPAHGPKRDHSSVRSRSAFAFSRRHSSTASQRSVQGAGLTALLQSSTATGLMTASFAAEGVVGLVPALAISEQDSAGRKRAAAIR